MPTDNTPTPRPLPADIPLRWVLYVSAVLFLVFFIVIAKLDNYEDAQHHYLNQANGWTKFIDSCRPHEYDKLGRVVVLVCPINPTQE